jgi:outer membrane protein assembly factor BamB
VALDGKTGKPVWTYPCPVTQRSRFGLRNLLGNLLITDGKLLWTSSAAGGGVCLDLRDGTELWKNNRMGTTGGFAFPTAQRVIDGMIFRDMGGLTPDRLADGERGEPIADLGGMLRRGHHIRCFPGKATERFLITPMRGAEFIDLHGRDHMVNDWLRGACSLGNMPANGLFYVTPDPCTCYAGARIYGFSALAPKEPAGLESAPAADDPSRLIQGPAYRDEVELVDSAGPTAWPIYRADAQRTARAGCILSHRLSPAWTKRLGGNLTQATIAGGRAYLVRKDRYELSCLDLQRGEIAWTHSFPAALDGPPTIVNDRLYLGCRDGRVYCLTAADGRLAWNFLAAPLDRLTLSEDRLESLWPVSASVLFHDNLIYAVAGRNSYLDGGVRLYALDAATGAVRHSAVLAGPWPDTETLKAAVVTERDRRSAESNGPAELEAVSKAICDQYATGYNLLGGEADLLVTDGTDLYLTQNKFDAQLHRMPVQRAWISGYAPLGANHTMASAGFLDDTMFHRMFMLYDDAWPSYGSGPGSAARGGTVVAVGRDRAYAAQHFERGGYAVHEPGSGNRIVADTLDTDNLPGGMFQRNGGLSDKTFDRTGPPLWTTETPVIIRSILVAPDGQGGELVFTAGIVEGTTREQWDQSTYFIGPGKLQVHRGENGKLLAEYDLPACPVFEGLSAADGKLLIALANGEVVCFGIRP